MPTQVDHIDHNPSNNAWANLRAADYAINGKNHPKTVRNKTGFVGVSRKSDGKYVARIYANKKHVFLGSFTDIADAIAARKAAMVRYGFHYNHGN